MKGQTHEEQWGVGVTRGSGIREGISEEVTFAPYLKGEMRQPRVDVGGERSRTGVKALGGERLASLTERTKANVARAG